MEDHVECFRMSPLVFHRHHALSIARYHNGLLLIHALDLAGSGRKLFVEQFQLLPLVEGSRAPSFDGLEIALCELVPSLCFHPLFRRGPLFQRGRRFSGIQPLPMHSGRHCMEIKSFIPFQ
jgi:hypothetical protein